jgi:hypothetical protein
MPYLTDPSLPILREISKQYVILGDNISYQEHADWRLVAALRAPIDPSLPDAVRLLNHQIAVGNFIVGRIHDKYTFGNEISPNWYLMFLASRMMPLDDTWFDLLSERQLVGLMLCTMHAASDTEILAVITEVHARARASLLRHFCNHIDAGFGAVERLED